MDAVHLVAQTLFSETKDLEDAKGIANVIVNRTKRPNRFGATVEDVIMSPKQFSGVGSNEWNKVTSGKLNKEEAELFKQFLSIANSAVKGTLEDNTGGADHYYNPKISKPSWGKVYPQTYINKYHRYLKEPTPAGKKAK